MEHDFFTILLDGEEATDLYADLVELEVDLDEGLAGMFRLRVSIRPDGESWTWLDDDRIKLWKPVAITGGVADAAQDLIAGYVTQIKPDFSAGEHNAVLELWGMDASVLMDRIEVRKAWPNKKDSDIASELFGLYGLTPEVEATTEVHDEAITTLLQRETDIQFLKRLALRNGYECFVQGSTGFFRKPSLAAEPKPVLAANFDTETTFEGVSLSVDALAPVQIGVTQLHRSDKDLDDVEVTSASLDALGGSDSSTLLGPGVEPAKIFVGPNGALGSAELQTFAQGLYDQADWFVSVQGRVLGNTYGNALLPRDNVTIKGLGETYSGVYRVQRVVHVFNGSGYSQQLGLRRNALGFRGDETFDAQGGGLLGALG